MKFIVSAAVLLVPMVALADVAPGGCGCATGATPFFATSLVVGAMGLLVFRRKSSSTR
jgi:hypothetical protein